MCLAVVGSSVGTRVGRLDGIAAGDGDGTVDGFGDDDFVGSVIGDGLCCWF